MQAPASAPTPRGQATDADKSAGELLQHPQAGYWHPDLLQDTAAALATHRVVVANLLPQPSGVAMYTREDLLGMQVPLAAVPQLLALTRTQAPQGRCVSRWWAAQHRTVEWAVALQPCYCERHANATTHALLLSVGAMYHHVVRTGRPSRAQPTGATPCPEARGATSSTVSSPRICTTRWSTT
jgi:hypothetical protein